MPILEAMCVERQRAEALRRRLRTPCAIRLSCCSAAGGVLLFFLLVVLPQFANVFKDFNAKLDPVLVTFLGLSDLLRHNLDAIGFGLAALLALGVPAGAPAVGAGGGARCGRAAAAGAPRARLSSDLALLPQPRPAARERRDAAG